MKIDYICIGYFPIVGGTETVVRNIAEIMAKKGYEVTVHTSTYNPNFKGSLKRTEVINGVKVIRYKLLPFYVFLPKIRNPDIVHLFSYGDNFIIQSFLHHSSRLVSSPIGEEVYSQNKLRNRMIGSKVLNYSNVIFAQTTYEKNQLSMIYGVDQARVTLWPAGVGDDDFLPPNLSNVRENILNISKMHYFIRLARLDRFKKIEFGVQLLPNLQDLKYVVVGTIDDMDYLKELKDLSKRLNVENRLIFTGQVSEDEKRLLLHESQFYLIANHETFGGATIEAMAQGVPIIAPNIEEYVDIVVNHVNSLTYKYDSILNCLNIINILKDNNDLRQKLGANGKTIVRENFYWERIADVAEKIYISLS